MPQILLIVITRGLDYVVPVVTIRPMQVNWFYLFVGLLFGLIPPLRLIACEVRYMTFETLWTDVLWRQYGTSRKRRWWKLPLVWIDPVRGYVVGYFLSQAFRAVRKATFFQAQIPLLALFIVVCVVMLVQTRGRPDSRESLSPAGFLAGLMFGMMPFMVAFGALVVGGATAVALQGYAGGYLIAMVMTGLLGGALIGTNPKVMVYAAIVGSPVWISWLRRTILVTPVRY